MAREPEDCDDDCDCCCCVLCRSSTGDAGLVQWTGIGRLPYYCRRSVADDLLWLWKWDVFLRSAKRLSRSQLRGIPRQQATGEIRPELAMVVELRIRPTTCRAVCAGLRSWRDRF